MQTSTMLEMELPQLDFSNMGNNTPKKNKIIDDNIVKNNQPNKNRKLAGRPVTDRSKYMSTAEVITKDVKIVDEMDQNINAEKQTNRVQCKTDRDLLLQKKKSYAQSIREKNKVKQELKKKDYSVFSSTVSMNDFSKPFVNQKCEKQAEKANDIKKKRSSLTERVNNKECEPQNSNYQKICLKNPSQSCLFQEEPQKPPHKKHSKASSGNMALKTINSRNTILFSASTTQSRATLLPSSTKNLTGKGSNNNNSTTNLLMKNKENSTTSSHAKIFFNKSNNNKQSHRMQTLQLQKDTSLQYSPQYLEKQTDEDFVGVQSFCSDFKKYSIQSKVIEQTVDNSKLFNNQQEKKQIELLKTQNVAFKRQLAIFRKQNSTLRKEQFKSKTKTQELIQSEKKAQQSRKQQEKIESFDKSIQESSLNQIIKSKDEDIFRTMGQNKALQLKVYILEKKLAQEEEAFKKKLASQIYQWRQRYTKLKNEHAKVKNLAITAKKSKVAPTKTINQDEQIQMYFSNDQGNNGQSQ